MTEKFFVDRIEGNTVFCEDKSGDEVRFDLNTADDEIKEGDVIFKNEKGRIQTDFEATSLRKKKISNLKKYIYKTKKQN